MDLRPSNGFAITLADMKFQRARRIHILSKLITLNSVITWLAWLATHVVFLGVPYALECALRLFVFAFNSRQLHKQRFPNYAAHVMDFVSP
jgi:hypothetical protein